MKWKTVCLVSAWMVMPMATTIAAMYPQLLRMKGRFTDTKVPLTETLPVRFSIWDCEEGYCNMLWQDTQEVAVKDNMFQVVLGRSTSLTPSVFSGGDRWVEIQLGSDAPMRPRHKIPNKDLQAQVAAVQAAPPPPAPARITPPPPTPPELTEEEKRELELQIEQYRETAARKAAKTVKVKPPIPAPAPVAGVSTSGGLGPTYEVRAGDTLKSIAQKLYGNAELWYDLYYLNRDRLGPMGHLFAGQILVLPSPSHGERKK